MKTLEETIREAEEHFKERWAQQADREKAALETPEGKRAAAAREIANRRLPEFVNQRIDVLRPRIHPDSGLLAAVDGWTWGAPSMLLCSPTRMGKTTAAAVLVRRLLGQGVRAGGEAWENARRIRWHHAASLANARKRHPLGHDEAPEIAEACSGSLLVLDDLGWDVEPEAISEVLNARYERQLPTLITSGQKPDELLDRYGDAVFRRIFDAGGERSGKTVSYFPDGKTRAARPASKEPAPPRDGRLP